MNYLDFVTGFARLIAEGSKLPLGGLPPIQAAPPPPNAPRALIFSPHPDDEVIIGGLPLRLLRELKMKVINVAVTLGSNQARQPERWKELTACCRHIGFGLMRAAPNGLEGVNVQTRTEHPKQWAESISRVVEILSEHQPRVIFFPHGHDWNSSHIGTHYLLLDA